MEYKINRSLFFLPSERTPPASEHLLEHKNLGEAKVTFKGLGQKKRKPLFCVMLNRGFFKLVTWPGVGDLCTPCWLGNRDIACGRLGVHNGQGCGPQDNHGQGPLATRRGHVSVALYVYRQHCRFHPDLLHRLRQGNSSYSPWHGHPEQTLAARGQLSRLNGHSSGSYTAHTFLYHS